MFKTSRILIGTDYISSWFSAIETLAWLHSLDPDEIGLQGYGKKTGFYARHCNTFSRIEAQQAMVKDAKTGKALGRAHENFDEITEYVRKNLPQDRYAIVHGDFKFDNMVRMSESARLLRLTAECAFCRYYIPPSHVS